MKVIELTQRYPPALGGVELHVQTIARSLSGLGHEVEIITSDLARDRPFSRLPHTPSSESFPVRRHRSFRGIPAPHGLGIVAPGMASDLVSTRADVVHAHAFGMAPTWIAAAVRRLRRMPLVVETHMDAGRGTPGWWTYARAVARFTLRPADRVVVQTRTESALVAALGIPTERIARISDGIDLGEFAGMSPRENPDPTTVLFVGRLYPEQKGLIPLLHAFALLPPALGLHLRLVGEDWGGRPIVERLAREHGLGDRITLTGPLPRAALLQEYARADLFVLPSLFEPYGIVLMEAMAAGLPIVATRVGGVPEVVEEGKNALLVPPGNPIELAKAMELLAREREKRRSFARAGQERVQQFSWTRIIPQWVRLLEQMVAQRS